MLFCFVFNKYVYFWEKTAKKYDRNVLKNVLKKTLGQNQKKIKKIILLIQCISLYVEKV